MKYSGGRNMNINRVCDLFKSKLELITRKEFCYDCLKLSYKEKEDQVEDLTC